MIIGKLRVKRSSSTNKELLLRGSKVEKIYLHIEWVFKIMEILSEDKLLVVEIV